MHQILSVQTWIKKSTLPSWHQEANKSASISLCYVKKKPTNHWEKQNNSTTNLSAYSFIHVQNNNVANQVVSVKSKIW